jgi:hypothetical protein
MKNIIFDSGLVFKEGGSIFVWMKEISLTVIG